MGGSSFSMERPSLADIHAGWGFDLVVKERYILRIDGKKLYPRIFAWARRMRSTVQKLQQISGKPAELSTKDTIPKTLGAGIRRAGWNG